MEITELQQFFKGKDCVTVSLNGGAPVTIKLQQPPSKPEQAKAEQVSTASTALTPSK